MEKNARDDIEYMLLLVDRIKNNLEHVKVKNGVDYNDANYAQLKRCSLEFHKTITHFKNLRRYDISTPRHAMEY